MPINHHASDELLLAYAAGRLSPAPALVVASHLAMSGQDAARLSAYEQLGGALLDEQPLANVAPDLFERMMARLDEPDAQENLATVADHGALDFDIALPAPLAMHNIGGWRWIGPGVRFANVDVPEDPDYKVLLLRVAAGKALPQHGHAGRELSLVLKGVFHDSGAAFSPGDIAEEDENSHHRPTVGPDGECICLIAIEGRLIPDSWSARLLLSWFGF